MSSRRILLSTILMAQCNPTQTKQQAVNIANLYHSGSSKLKSPIYKTGNIFFFKICFLYNFMFKSDVLAS